MENLAKFISDTTKRLMEKRDYHAEMVELLNNQIAFNNLMLVEVKARKWRDDNDEQT